MRFLRWSGQGDIFGASMEQLGDELEEYRKVKCIKIDSLLSCDESIFNTEHTLKIFSTNIRSYNKNFDLLLSHLNLIKTKFDLIILGETWLGREGQGTQIEGYRLFETSMGKTRNDGVIVYVRESVQVYGVNEVEVGDVFGLSLECSYLGKQCNLLAIYRTHMSELDIFTNALANYYDNIVKHKTYVLVGDINVNLLDRDAKTERYLDCLYEAGFMCCIDEPTRVVNDTKTCLDHIFVHHDNFKNIQSAVIESDITDHYSVCLGITFQSSRLPTSLTYTYIDKIQLGEIITNCDWSSVTGEENVNICANSFFENVVQSVEKSTKTKTYKPRLVPLKPWITEGIVLSIRKRDKLSKLMKKQPFNARLKQYYKNYRNTLHTLIKTTKVMFYKGKISDARNNPKIFWRTINELAGKSTKNESFPLEKYTSNNQQNCLQVDLRERVAKEFNQYFSQVGYNLASKIDCSGPPVVNDDDYTSDAQFTLHQITNDELRVYVNSLRGGSAPGYDGISANFLKNNFNAFCKPLLHIINLSLKTGIFPEVFKIAKVIPIYKSNDFTASSNYRPISLLSVFSKVLEKIVKDQLLSYLVINNILNNKQFGFQKSKNIADALFSLNESINKAISCGNKSLIMFLDLAKAFDSLDRTVLLKKMERIGIKGSAMNWFKTYLENRKQFVYINGSKSDLKTVDYGVIQGSTLGPLLFLIYVNNLPNIRINGELFLFADDTAVFIEDKNWDILFEKATRDISLLKKWFDQNLLTLNIAKTKFMPIYLRNSAGTQVSSITLHTCGETEGCSCGAIERVNSYKYLGVVFDSKLTWKEHITYVNTKLRKLIYAFKQLHEVLQLHEIRMAYCAFAQSIIEGGIIAWGGAYKSYIQPLQITQKAIIKAGLGKSRRYPSNLVFSELKVFDIRQLYIRALVLYVFKNSDQLFTNITHNYSTRSVLSEGIQIPRLIKTFSTTNSYYISHMIYKNLPESLKNFQNYSQLTFKKALTKWLVEIGIDNTELLMGSMYR